MAKETKIEWRVQNLDCENEAKKIRRGLEKLDGLLQLKIYSSAAKIAAEIDTDVLSEDELKARLDSLGFPVLQGREIATLPKPWKNPKVVTAALSGIILALTWLAEYFSILGEPVSTGLYSAAILIGGYFFGREAIEELFAEFNIGIEMLMAVAAVVALITGQSAEAATLVFLYSISEATEGYTEERTRSAIRALMDLTPKTAFVLRDGKELEIPAEELQVGDRFLVRPGGSIPTDGIIRKGTAAIDESTVTGESIPVQKSEGAQVFAGSINQTGALEIEATKAFHDNTISRIIHLVEEAQEEKGESQKIIQRFGRKYSPAVLATGILIAVVPPMLGAAWQDWITRATIFIVSAAPCALVMSIPLTVVAAIGTASRRGVLIKGGIYLERLARSTVLCFDKTGTLTRGRPEVTDIEPVADGLSTQELLAYVAAAESRSEHPLAGAILRHAQNEGLQYSPPDEFTALPGAGLQATVDGHTVLVARPDYFQEDGWAPLKQHISDLQNAGKTVVAVSLDNQPAGILAIRDELRPNAKEAVLRLRSTGLKRLIMLTGDNEGTARAIAGELGLDAFFAELRPEDKSTKIQELDKEYGGVVMVGDGVNDAPALAAASVGVAMGAAGTDVALETADVALMADDLSKLEDALRLSRKAQRLIKQNIWLSVSVIVLLVAGSLSGAVSLPLAVLGHELSEFAVIGNGLRMLGRTSA